MKQIILERPKVKNNLIFIILLTSIGCVNSQSSRNVSLDGFKSKTELWGLEIAEVNVDSLNSRGFPIKYVVISEIRAGQKGDYKEDEELEKMRERDGLKLKIKHYGYLWKPQKYISFKKTNKYYNWWIGSTEYDILPLEFKKGHWYLFTKWQPSSSGGGIYELFAYLNDKGEFEKHFNIITNW